MKTGQISLMDARVIQAKPHRPNQGAAGESTQATEAAYKVKQSSLADALLIAHRALTQ